ALGALTGAIASATAGRSHEQPFVLAPQEGGDFSAFPDLPPRAAPGDLSGVLDAASEAARTARRLKQLGFNGVLAPDADVGAGTGADPLGPRAYSEDARQVSAYVAAVVAAFRRARMLSAPLHFPGIGGATGSTDDGPAEGGLDMRALGRRDRQPLRAAVRAGSPVGGVGQGGSAAARFRGPGRRR